MTPSSKPTTTNHSKSTTSAPSHPDPPSHYSILKLQTHNCKVSKSCQGECFCAAQLPVYVCVESTWRLAVCPQFYFWPSVISGRNVTNSHEQIEEPSIVRGVHCRPWRAPGERRWQSSGSDSILHPHNKSDLITIVPPTSAKRQRQPETSINKKWRKQNGYLVALLY